jgi:hypothetical protein
MNAGKTRCWVVSFDLKGSQERPRADTRLLDDASCIFALTPEDRLREAGNVNRFEAAARVSWPES